MSAATATTTSVVPCVTTFPEQRIYVIDVDGNMMFVNDAAQIKPIIQAIFDYECRRLLTGETSNTVSIEGDSAVSGEASAAVVTPTPPATSNPNREVFRRESEGETKIYRRELGWVWNSPKELVTSIKYGPAIKATYVPIIPTPPPLPTPTPKK
jgi:hypothetical protein